QQRLVANLVGAMPARIDHDRSGEPSAIAAREKYRALARRDQDFRDRERARRLAGAADRWIADAHDRDAGPFAWPFEPRPRHGAIEFGRRGQKHRGDPAVLPPPERRRAHRFTAARGEAASDKARATP